MSELGKKALQLVEAVLDRWDWDNPHVSFEFEGILVMASYVDGTDEEPPTLFLYGPHEGLQELAYEAVGMWFAEATNSDACDVEVREIAAHFSTNRAVPDEWKELPDIFGATKFGDEKLIVIAKVHDYLS